MAAQKTPTNNIIELSTPRFSKEAKGKGIVECVKVALSKTPNSRIELMTPRFSREAKGKGIMNVRKVLQLKHQ